MTLLLLQFQMKNAFLLGSTWLSLWLLQKILFFPNSYMDLSDWDVKNIVFLVLGGSPILTTPNFLSQTFPASTRFLSSSRKRNYISPSLFTLCFIFACLFVQEATKFCIARCPFQGMLYRKDIVFHRNCNNSMQNVISDVGQGRNDYETSETFCKIWFSQKILYREISLWVEKENFNLASCWDKGLWDSHPYTWFTILSRRLRKEAIPRFNISLKFIQ